MLRIYPSKTMFKNHAKENIKLLAEELGYEFSEYHYIENSIREKAPYDNIVVKEKELKVLREEVRSLRSLVERNEKDFNELMEHLGIEIFRGREMRKKKK